MWRVKVDYSASNIDFVFDTLLKTTSSFHLETQMKLAGRLYTFFKVPIARGDNNRRTDCDITVADTNNSNDRYVITRRVNDFLTTSCLVSLNTQYITQVQSDVRLEWE